MEKSIEVEKDPEIVANDGFPDVIEENDSSGFEDKDMTSDEDNNENDRNDDSSPLPSGFWESNSARMARNPCIHLCTSLIIGIALSYVALVVGEFSVSANTGGWQSRGTLIADRHTQLLLVKFNQDYLFYDNDEAWDELINNVQPGWDVGDDDDGRRLDVVVTNNNNNNINNHATYPSLYHEAQSLADLVTPQAQFHQLSEKNNNNRNEKLQRNNVPFHLTPEMKRRLQEQSNTFGEGCDMDWYSFDRVSSDTRLWPVWKVKQSDTSAIDAQVIYDICVAELNTLKILEDRDLCFGCDDGCLPPFSLVLYARFQVENGFALSCAELRDAWAPLVDSAEQQLKTCVQDVKTSPSADGSLPESCPEGFFTTMVDESYDSTLVSTYTASIFPTTSDDVDEMYEIRDSFDRGSKIVQAAYDTQWEDFLIQLVDASIIRDMSLAMASAFIVAVAMIIHTKSIFISLVGLMQIILSFPLAFFVYRFIAGFEFFPFLNFIGIFVVFALGADDVFVAVDKWKNARLEHPEASTEYIAAVALPDAAGAMFLTTSTTAIAFFGTAICPVAPIKMFAIFCGLLIMFDYIMNILLVFPALCIYDTKYNCFFRCCCGNNDKDTGSDGEVVQQLSVHDIDEEENPSLIRRILLFYYNLLHTIRWPLLVACMVGLGLCIYFASTLTLPTSSDVRLLDESNELEQNYLWKNQLLYNVLAKESGSEAYMIWGVKPADTGDQNTPDEFTSLVLDDTFNPANQDSQIYLNDFCKNLFDQEFAIEPVEGYLCPMNQFDLWLQEQVNLSAGQEQDSIYLEHCDGATGIPMAEENFNACIIAWAKQQGENGVLSRNGNVEILLFPFTSRVRFDNPYDVLDKEWHKINEWVTDQSKTAPPGAQNGYFSSEDFWWYDTNGQMLKTAYSSSAIALAAAAIIILLSSRSFTLTLFATIAVGYVLTSVTSALVGLGWTLGFLESICFAILIGISVDFVIHFSHAYSSSGDGDKDRSNRTKFALITMGPSILAAAFTTMASALIMLFTVILFFQKFALILFMTVIQATIGSFVVFLTLCDCFGPTNPTSTVDAVLGKCGITPPSHGDGGDNNGSSRSSPLESEDVDVAKDETQRTQRIK